MLARILLFSTRFIIGLVKAMRLMLPYIVAAGFLKRRPDNLIYLVALLVIGEIGGPLL